MKKPYKIVHDTSTASSRELAEWLAKDGQLLVPPVELLEKGERAIDEVIDVDEPFLLRRLDMEFGLLDGHHEALRLGPSGGAELHQQEETLQRRQSGPLPRRRERWSFAVFEVRNDGLQNAFTVCRRQAQLELRRSSHEVCQFAVDARDNRREAVRGLEFLDGRPDTLPLRPDGCGRQPAGRRDHLAKEFRGKRNPAIPGARCRDKEEAQFLQGPASDCADGLLSIERIADIRVVVNEEP